MTRINVQELVKKILNSRNMHAYRDLQGRAIKLVLKSRRTPYYSVDGYGNVVLHDPVKGTKKNITTILAADIYTVRE
jgi:hypothetical protein